ncbi:hypothetical protein [Clostridioides difficile]|uniref:hypothetical protein n=1 Tax=Clostridioides difficile TaxID=1496 RepID=UPI000D699710|nr:hypothetical protein [Clostridioides difficile]MDE3652399.1 hypothetical protein [Clostridioides difficile]HBE8953839.1 hypothetical protein [Clostridioides difficile]HBF7205506.1 hypothetical protein [Clostridioides difficile]HBF7378406.1 hypothetical protein [Clostridioides difficile]HBG5539842.1 hypothetical protein [Clostridioides difficile]
MLSVNEMRIERIQYNLLVNDYLNSINFGGKSSNKFYSFIVFILLVNSFFCWCSSSPESNIYIFSKKLIPNKYIPYIPIYFSLIIIIVAFFIFIFTVNAIKKEVFFKSLCMDYTQESIFNFFIRAKLVEKYPDIKTDKDILKIMNSENVSNILFYEKDFELFVENYLKENYLKKDYCLLKKYYPISVYFYKDITKLILLNHCIENKIICTGEGYFIEYIFITKYGYFIL